MITGNLQLGPNVYIDSTSSINHITIGMLSKVAKNCSLYGSKTHQLIIGSNTYIGMNSIINGYNEKVTIGSYVSIAQNVNIMSDSGPNMSHILQQKFPLEVGKVEIGDHCWIGAGVTILPGTKIGNYCVVGANSVVKGIFEDGSVIAGCLAKKIRVESYDLPK